MSGDDFGILRQCGGRVEDRFAWIGAFVLLVFLLCFASSYLSFIKLFPNYLVGLPIAVFFAWMVTNIYLLLLYTLSKNLLPHKRSTATRIFSTLLRIAFLCFIAVVVSKPLEVLIFSIPLEQEISDYKSQKLAEYKAATEEFFAGEINQLKLTIEKQKNLGGNSTDERIEKYRKQLVAKESQKASMLADMQNLIERSNYYVQSIVILNSEYPTCWFFTVICMSVFIAPAALKILVSEKSDYYQFKKRIEMKLVLNEYFLFKTNYHRVLHENFGVDKDYVEIYLDPPFNTALKIDRTKIFAESDLISDLYRDA